MKNKIKFLFKLFISILILYLIFRKFSWKDAAYIWDRIHFGFLMAVLCSHLIMNILITWRWSILLLALGTSVSFFELLRYHFIGLFFQIILPASSGTDIVKSLYLSRHISSDHAFASVIMGRIMGLAVMLVMAMVVYIFNPGILIAYGKLAKHFFIAVVVITAFFGLFLIKADSYLFKILPENLRKNLIYNFFEGIHVALLKYRQNKSYVIECAVISLAIVCFLILIHWFLFFAIGLKAVSLVYLFFVVPIILAATMIPVTINGLGIREALYFYFFVGLAGTQQRIMEFSIVNIIMVLIPSLLGSIIYIINRK